MDNRPIGVFDSGLGGLTGVRQLRLKDMKTLLEQALELDKLK